MYYIVLYCTDTNKLTVSIFQKEKKEVRGGYWAKVGIMGIILPTVNLIGLIVSFIEVGRNRKTFECETALFTSYFAANTFLPSKIAKKPESEVHGLRENNPPAENSIADYALVDNSPMDNAPPVNSPAANAPMHNAQVDHFPADNSPANNSPAYDLLADNSPAKKKKVRLHFVAFHKLL